MKNRLKLFFGLLIIFAIFIWAGAFSTASVADTNLHIYFLNVGQGDSEYIKTPSGNDILIDGGPDDTVLSELGKVMNLGDRKIDLVILTHPHADHLTGLISVINRYEIGEIWETGVEYSSGTYDTWKNSIKEKGIKSELVDENYQKIFDGVKIKVLYPLSNLKNQTIDNLNNSSIISELDYNQFSALFLGDAEISAQAQILKKIKPMTVMKIAHHGSQNALNKDLMQIVRPSLVIIQVGSKNTYGHPSSNVILYLKSLAAQIYRTDEDGTIEIISNGETYWKR